MTYLDGDIPIEATESFFRGDTFRFIANAYRFVGGKRGDRVKREAATGFAASRER